MKKNLTSAKNALSVYSILVKKPMTKEEVSEFLGIKLSTFFKYVAQLRKAGINIEKTGLFYYAGRFCGTIQLGEIETSILAHLLYLSYDMFPEVKTKQLKKTVKKILDIAQEDSYYRTIEKFELFKEANYKRRFREKIELLQKYKDMPGCTLKILTRTKKEYIFSPIDFHWGRGKVYFYFLDCEKRKRKMIPIDKIVKITPDDEVEYEIEGSETIFELYGRLAKSYVLKDNERIVDCKDGYIVVANGDCDKEILFRRLLRYDSLCKVLYPKQDAENFKKLIQKALDNISGLQDNKS